MVSKRLAISSFASTQLVGGSVAAIVLSQTSTENTNKKINLKDMLIKQGYKALTSFGPKSILLRQYSDFKNDKGDLSQWCNQNKMTEKDNEELIKEFKEICFETIASKIDFSDFAILKIGSDGDQDGENWTKALSDFRKDYLEGSQKKPSEKWSNTDNLQNFQNQCKKHEREPFFDEQNELFQEVKKYCTRKREWVS